MGAGVPGWPSLPNSSAAEAVDLRASLFLRRRPAFSCLFLRLTLVAFVFEAMAGQFLALLRLRCQFALLGRVGRFGHFPGQLSTVAKGYVIRL